MKPPRAGRRFDPLLALIIAAAAWAVVPGYLQLQFGIRPGAGLGNVEVTTPSATLAKGALLYLVYALSAAAVLGSIVRRVRSQAWLLIYLAPWLALTISSFAATRSFTVTSLIYLAIGTAVLDHPDKMRLLKAVGVLTAWVAAISILMTFTTSNAVFSQAQVPDAKAIIGSTLLNGPFYHPNTLGLVLALGFPWAFLIQRRAWRRFSLVLILFALVWSASRTSLLAVMVGLVVAGLWLLFRRVSRQTGLLVGLPLIALYVAVIPIGAILVATARPDSFSARGVIWDASLALFREKPVLGWGSDIYVSIEQTRSAIGSLAFHGHNMFVNTLTVAGIVGVVALVLLYFKILAKSWRFGNSGADITLAMWPVVFICLGWLEVPTTFYTFGYTSWVVWVPLAVILSLPAREQPNPAHTDASLGAGHVRERNGGTAVLPGLVSRGG